MEVWGNKNKYQKIFDNLNEYEKESLEERAGIIEFCSKDYMLSRKRSERLAIEQYLNHKQRIDYKK